MEMLQYQGWVLLWLLSLSPVASLFGIISLWFTWFSVCIRGLVPCSKDTNLVELELTLMASF